MDCARIDHDTCPHAQGERRWSFLASRNEGGASAAKPVPVGGIDLHDVGRWSVNRSRDTVVVGLAITVILHGLLLVVATSLHAAETSAREASPPRTVQRDPLMVVLHNPHRAPEKTATPAPEPRTRPTLAGGRGNDKHIQVHRRPVAMMSPATSATPPPPPAIRPAAVPDNPATKRDEDVPSVVAIPSALEPMGHMEALIGNGGLRGEAVAGGTRCCGTGTGVGAGTGIAHPVRVPARPIDSPRPIYPRQARLMGWEGTVVLRVLVSADGRTAEVTVVAGSGYLVLDESAVDAARRWRFSPALENGHPTAMAHEVRIRFRLDDQAG
jgi:protein TonB